MTLPHRSLNRSPDGGGADLLALVAIGSNLGETPADNVRRAMDCLERFSTRPILRSSLWRSRPVDCPPGSPLFINAAAGLWPVASESPDSLLSKLQSLEKEFGRRPKRLLNEPRPLDLDLIDFGGRRQASPLLTLPHPRAHQRRFVLEPLAEIVPGVILPDQSLTIRQLLAGLDRDGLLTRFD